MKFLGFAAAHVVEVELAPLIERLLVFDAAIWDLIGTFAACLLPFSL